MFYKKEFVMNPHGNVFLNNPAPAIAYVEKKIDALFKTRTDYEAQRHVKCQIFSDFKAIYEYDLENAIFPEPFGTFASEAVKGEFVKQKILYKDFQLYLGNIFVNYHNQLAKANDLPIIEAFPFVIDYNELFATAIAEYIRVLLRIPYPVQLRRKHEADLEYSVVEYEGKKLRIPHCGGHHQPHACAASFILPSLIEHSLLIYLENTVIARWLNGMVGKNLDPDEDVLYRRFLCMKKVGHGVIEGDRKRAMERIWNMGVKYDAFSNDRSMKEILCGRDGNHNTLGAILKSAYARSCIRPEYLQILDYMFDKKMLNLRNSIAHGISTTYDYLSLSFVGVMVQMIWDICANDVIMGYEFR